MTRTPALLLLGLAAAAPATAQGRAAAPVERVRLLLSGAFDVSSLSYRQTLGFTEFVEEGRLEARYEVDPGPGFDVGAQIRALRGLGLVTSYSRVERDTSGSFAVDVPHPLFFGQPRSAEGALAAARYREQAVHVGLSWSLPGGPLDLTLFGGASFFRVSAELVEGVSFTQSYPFDQVIVTGTPSAERVDTPLGFHVGGRVDYRIGRRFGLGAQARFSRASARVPAVGGGISELDAGGLQLAVGARLYF